MLEQEKIPFEFEDCHSGYHLSYPDNTKNRVCSVVEHGFSYGAEDDKLEIMGLLTDEEKEADVGDESSVAGFLTAKDVFSRIKKHYGEKA